MVLLKPNIQTSTFLKLVRATSAWINEDRYVGEIMRKEDLA